MGCLWSRRRPREACRNAGLLGGHVAPVRVRVRAVGQRLRVQSPIGGGSRWMWISLGDIGVDIGLLLRGWRNGTWGVKDAKDVILVADCRT